MANLMNPEFFQYVLFYLIIKLYVVYLIYYLLLLESPLCQIFGDNLSNQ